MSVAGIPRLQAGEDIKNFLYTSGMPKHISLLFVLCLFLCLPVRGEVSVVDATGRSVRLEQPARRIVSLAPHLTEQLFAAGAGAFVVGVPSYSDYPPEAKRLPVIGRYSQFDPEAVAARRPDLVVAWQGGSSSAALERLRSLGIPIYIDNARTFEDIALTLENLGELAGTRAVAKPAADQFRQRLAGLETRYKKGSRVRVFYEIWHQPLMTINREHSINAVIRLCGGENVFASLSTLTPTITTEQVLAVNPDLIIASGMDEARPEWLDNWRHWPELKATQTDNLQFVPPDILQRPTLRLLDGAAMMCEKIAQTREKA